MEIPLFFRYSFIQNFAYPLLLLQKLKTQHKTKVTTFISNLHIMQKKRFIAD